MPNGTTAVESVTKLLERLAYQVNHTLHQPNADSVHDLRVAIRRFAQSLTLSKPVFAPKEVKKIRRRLKELRDLTNAPRDCDVALKLLPKSGIVSATALETPIQQRRKEALQLLKPALRRWAARKTSSKWRSALTPNGDVPADHLPRLYKRVLKHGARANSAEDLHQLRIEGKKLRYSLEILQKNGVETVQQLQTLLGSVNDTRAVRHLVADLGADAELKAWLKNRQKKKTREFHDAWPAIEQAMSASLTALQRSAGRPMVQAAGQTRPAQTQAG